MLTPALVAFLLLNPTMRGGNTYFEDFEDGIADGWLVHHGDWTTANGNYRGIGRPNGSMVDNFSWVPETASAGMSVEAVLSSDPLFDDVNKMIVLRYQNPQNAIVVNFRAGWRHDVVVSQGSGGTGSLLTPEFLYNIPEHGPTEPKRCRVDIVDKTVVAYFEGVRVMDVTLPTIAVMSGSAGLNVFSSPGGGDEELFCDEFSWAASEFATASSLVTEVGASPIGSLGTVGRSDNIYFQVSPAWNVARNDPNVRLVWSGKVNLLPARELTFRFESSVTSGSTIQKLAVYDWQSAQYVELDTRQISTTDNQIRVPLNASRNIGPSGDVRVRATYFAGAYTSRFSVKVDEINMQVIAQ